MQPIFFGANIAVAYIILVIAYHVLKEKRPYQELGGDYFDRIRADGLKRYYVRRLQGLGLEVTITPVAVNSLSGIFSRANSVASALGIRPSATPGGPLCQQPACCGK